MVDHYCRMEHSNSKYYAIRSAFRKLHGAFSGVGPVEEFERMNYWLHLVISEYKDKDNIEDVSDMEFEKTFMEQFEVVKSANTEALRMYMYVPEELQKALEASKSIFELAKAHWKGTIHDVQYLKEAADRAYRVVSKAAIRQNEKPYVDMDTVIEIYEEILSECGADTYFILGGARGIGDLSHRMARVMGNSVDVE